MTTEKEAASVWCPVIRHEDPDVKGGSWNRGRQEGNPANVDADGSPGSYACNCIGSRCMAWRWDDNGLSASVELRKHGKTPGYCGLAGKP